MRRLHAPAALALLLATACGGGGGDAGPTYTVSGTVTV